MPAFIGVTEAQSLPAWDITVTTTDVSQDYTIDIAAGTTPAIRVDWGDGTVETFTSTGQKTHTYTAAGTYQPRISGKFASDGNIQLGSNAGNRARLKSTGVIPLIVGLSKFEVSFGNCTGITSIPADLFRYNPQVAALAFYSVFSGCTGLTSIPSDLFKYNTLASALAFSFAFRGCTGLTSIPSGLFDYNVSVSTWAFLHSFYLCSNITSIPSDLFKLNTAVSSSGFNSTFYVLNKITSIPADLFRYNTLVSTEGFFETFAGCTSLETAPANLFKYNTVCDSFKNVLANCNKLQLRADLFFGAGEETTRFLDKTVDFTGAMKIVTFTGTQGTAPALWSCDFGTGTPTKTDCFDGHSSSSITNDGDIPAEWH